MKIQPTTVSPPLAPPTNRSRLALMDEFVNEIKLLRGSVAITRDVVSVQVMEVSDVNFDDVLWDVRRLMSQYLGSGHSWGTDGVGYYCNKERHMVHCLQVVKPRMRNDILKSIWG